MDFNKYDPMKQKKTIDSEAGFTSADYDDHSQAPGITCGIDVQKNGAVVHPPWMSSAPVILLIEYLRKYPDQGAILYERFGTVGLKFKPGIKGDDIKNGRAQIAMNMFRLLQDASADLQAMIAKGIEIPLLIKYQPKAKVQ